VAQHPETRKPLYQVPHAKGYIGLAANFVLHIAERMKTESAPKVEQELAAVAN
jgi:hypothetical protein